MIHVAVINASDTPEEQLEEIVAAAQVALDRDFSPAWGICARLVLYTHADEVAGKVPKGFYRLVLCGKPDVANALGYHDRGPDGEPLAKVFDTLVRSLGLSLSVTFMHELFEMLGNPNVNLVVIMQGEGGKLIITPQELCDGVEDDSFAYNIGNVAISNFAYPAYFVQESPAGTKLDHQNLVRKPFGLLRGGYMSVLKAKGGGWTQVEAELEPGEKPPASRHGASVHSRHERMNRPRHLWKNSVPRLPSPTP